MPRHCDLAHIDEPESNLLKFNTEVELNEVAADIWPTTKPAGTYRLRVAVVADNSKPRYWQLRIVFSGNWYDDEAEMFENGVRVEVESRP